LKKTEHENDVRMSVMSIRIDEKKRKQLKTIASVQGKTMSSIVEELIVDYVDNYLETHSQNDELTMIMKASESVFEEWSNDEDAVYDDL
jgi:predicted transcriptional regulator